MTARLASALFFATFALSACGQPARVAADRESRETDEQVERMAQHPSLANGETRKGPDSELLPPPRFPNADAHHDGHDQHGK